MSGNIPGARDTDPDIDLVEALQSGNDAALNELISRHERPLFGFIYRYVRNEEDARELLSETFVRLYFKCRFYRPSASFKTWLYRISINLCRDHCRRRRRMEWRQTRRLSRAIDESDEFASDVADDSCIPSCMAVSREIVDEVRRVIDELPSKLKAALILHVLEERPQAECAVLLGISPKSVETRIYRARRLLASWLQPHIQECIPFSRWLRDRSRSNRVFDDGNRELFMVALTTSRIAR